MKIYNKIKNRLLKAPEMLPAISLLLSALGIIATILGYGPNTILVIAGVSGAILLLAFILNTFE